MLGHRGIRLGMTYPEIYEMQARAISEAKTAVEGRGVKVRAEIMLPLTSEANELIRLRELIKSILPDSPVGYDDRNTARCSDCRGYCESTRTFSPLVRTT